MGLRALQLMMGLGRPALESELGRKSTDLRARKRSRAHLKRTHGALQRSFGGRLRGEKPAERRARPDRRSGAHRSAQERRKATRPAQDEPCERFCYGGKGCCRKAGDREEAGGDIRSGPYNRAGGTTAAGDHARRRSTRRRGSAGTRACGAGRRSRRRGSRSRRSSPRLASRRRRHGRPRNRSSSSVQCLRASPPFKNGRRLPRLQPRPRPRPDREPAFPAALG